MLKLHKQYTPWDVLEILRDSRACEDDSYDFSKEIIKSIMSKARICECVGTAFAFNNYGILLVASGSDTFCYLESLIARKSKQSQIKQIAEYAPIIHQPDGRKLPLIYPLNTNMGDLGLRCKEILDHPYKQGGYPLKHIFYSTVGEEGSFISGADIPLESLVYISALEQKDLTTKRITALQKMLRLVKFHILTYPSSFEGRNANYTYEHSLGFIANILEN